MKNSPRSQRAEGKKSLQAVSVGPAGEPVFSPEREAIPREMFSLGDELKKNRIIPVVVIEDSQLADPLAGAIASGGLTCVEITLRTGVALEAIRIMANRPNMVVGAGTVLSIDQAKAALDSGARFIVSPGFSMQLVNWCLENGIPVIPGCATSTEIQSALEAGLNIVKFFPAESLGGAGMLSALASVFRNVRFMPTGGVTSENIFRYLAIEQVIACGGSWMVKAEWLRERRFDKIQSEISHIVESLRNKSL
jgi:2-dehydro-3-deoxyphosphogluconate aldolase/(4S)-4-hydroxy-2-oxoglutarate aldolase